MFIVTCVVLVNMAYSECFLTFQYECGVSTFGNIKALTPHEALFSLMDQGVMPVYRMNMFRCIDGSTKETPDPPPQSVADVRRLFSEGWSYYSSINRQSIGNQQAINTHYNVISYDKT